MFLFLVSRNWFKKQKMKLRSDDDDAEGVANKIAQYNCAIKDNHDKLNLGNRWHQEMKEFQSSKKPK